MNEEIDVAYRMRVKEGITLAPFSLVRCDEILEYLPPFHLQPSINTDMDDGDQFGEPLDIDDGIALRDLDEFKGYEGDEEDQNPNSFRDVQISPDVLNQVHRTTP